MFYFFLSILKGNYEKTFLHFVFCVSDLLLAQDGVIKEVIAIQVIHLIFVLKKMIAIQAIHLIFVLK
jgi:hypothetical protein